MQVRIHAGQFEPESTRRRARRGPGRFVLAGFIAISVALAGAGVALATIPDSGTGVFHGCVKTATGDLRVIDPSKGQACTSSEKAVSWNQAGIRWQGTWSAKVAYVAGDAVAYRGSSYLSTASSTGAVPAAGSSNWATLARAGADGLQGADGKTILNGATPPGKLTGTAGDFYLDTATDVIYGPATLTGTKAKGVTVVWGSGTSLVGKPGTNGQGIVYSTSSGSINIPNGNSTRIVSQEIPVAGDYQVSAQVTLHHSGNDNAWWDCSLVVDNPSVGVGTVLDDGDLTIAPISEQITGGLSLGEMELEGVAHIEVDGVVGITCSEVGAHKGDAVDSVNVFTTQVSGFDRIAPSPLS